MDAEDVRLAVYAGFAGSGRAPSVDELTRALRGSPEHVRRALAALAADRHLVLDPGGERVVMAHPFSSVPLGFSVMGARTLWWGGCAWDSFSLVHLLPGEDEVLVATTCPACSTPHAWRVTAAAPPPGDQVAHFLVPVAHMWDDVVHTCGHQRLFCDARCVATWLDRTGHEQGYVMDLATLWRLAAHWYDGRLDRGYARREPEAAEDYFASVGLDGPFWGL
ncbi:MAG TPA: organomercurial lyase [Acidimicrobiales bacterium]|nr:organomercurial lyase [Acidimicrobiales bacterium]